MHPESSIITLGASMSSSVDQCPHTIACDADRRDGCENQGAKPSGVRPGPRFSCNSIVSSALQKRRRVQALTTTRKRS
jgi:hypothetical protein